ncbi:thiamine/thiamine pyrophosphate ABC transporter, permease protein [Marinobacter sp. X15-166B]|nr:thiamine/thiamine pyrophosphate ABC transporter, permease protein [Marinobacter sp. X15-166B]
MTHHLQRIPFSKPGWRLWPGTFMAAAIILLTLSGLSALLWQAPVLEVAELWQSRYLRGVVHFSIWQALLSVILSLLVALPVARALAQLRVFPGRSLLLRLMELSLVMPTIVAVSGLISVYGRQGWLTVWVQDWLPALGWNLYGINGIVLAHVFFNGPLAARILLQALEAVPQPQQRLASQLGLSSWWRWRALEWPAIRAVLPGLGALIFTLCFTSFAIVMTLGGGPSATTLEVAIYQALRFEFDFGRAALLAMVQLLICGSLWWGVLRKGLNTDLAPQRTFAQHQLFVTASRTSRLLYGLLLAGFVVFMLLPLLAVVTRGLPGLWSTEVFAPGSALLDATLRSLAIALPAGGVAVLVALLLLAAGHRSHRWFTRTSEAAGYLPLMVPPLVLGTGLFLLLRPQLGASNEGLLLVTVINGMMALPFVMQVLRGPLHSLDTPSRNLADQLGILGWYRWRWLHWPRMRRPLALGMAYGIGLSLGDFGVIALFGTPGKPTLPMLLYQQLGSYQIHAAAATGLWLVLLLLTVFAVFNLLGWSGSQRPRLFPLTPIPEPRHA